MKPNVTTITPPAKRKMKGLHALKPWFTGLLRRFSTPQWHAGSRRMPSPRPGSRPRALPGWPAPTRRRTGD